MRFYCDEVETQPSALPQGWAYINLWLTALQVPAVRIECDNRVTK